MLRIKRAPFQAILILTLRLNGYLRIEIVLFSNIIPRRCLQAEVASYLFHLFFSYVVSANGSKRTGGATAFFGCDKGKVYLSIQF